MRRSDGAANRRRNLAAAARFVELRTTLKHRRPPLPTHIQRTLSLRQPPQTRETPLTLSDYETRLRYLNLSGCAQRSSLRPQWPNTTHKGTLKTRPHNLHRIYNFTHQATQQDLYQAIRLHSRLLMVVMVPHLQILCQHIRAMEVVPQPALAHHQA